MVAAAGSVVAENLAGFSQECGEPSCWVRATVLITKKQAVMKSVAGADVYNVSTSALVFFKAARVHRFKVPFFPEITKTKKGPKYLR